MQANPFGTILGTAWASFFVLCSIPMVSLLMGVRYRTKIRTLNESSFKENLNDSVSIVAYTFNNMFMSYFTSQLDIP